MRDIRRLDSTESIVDRLTDPKFTETGEPVFKTIMELLIFAAGIGFSSKRRTPVSSSGKAVPYRIFKNNEKDGYLYLLALAETKNSECLGPDDNDMVAQIFEEYAAGGLEEITDWLNDNPTDGSGVHSLIAKLQSRIGPVSTTTLNPNPI